MEATIFTPWGKSVIPFPSLRKKIKAFKEDSSRQMTLTWNNNMMPQSPTPSKPSKSPRKCAPGKTRTQWSKHIHCFNPIKTSRFDTLGTGSTDINKINIIQPTPQKACEHFGATCSFCRQQAPYLLLVQLDWSSKDWDDNKAKAREQKSLISF